VKPYFRPAGASIESQAEPDDSMLKLLRRTERLNHAPGVRLFLSLMHERRSAARSLSC